MKTVRIVVVRVGQPPQVEGMEDSLKAMQEIVGGYIEGHGVGNQVFLYCNEDGVSKNLPQNGCGILGDFFFSKVDLMGATVSLSDEECEQIMAYVVAHRQVRHSGKSDISIHEFKDFDELQAFFEKERFDNQHRN